MSLPTDPLFYLVATFVVILVGLAKGGFAGLGSAALPLLVLVMDPVRAAAMLLPILIVQDVVSVWAFRRNFDGASLKLMLPGGLLGVLLGWLFASAVPSDAVRAVVGLISLVFGLQRMFGVRQAVGIPARSRPQWLGAFWGTMSGFTSQVAHAGGSPYQVWMLPKNLPHTVYVGTSSLFFATLNWVKVPAYWALGQFTRDNMQLTLIFMPVAILSTLAGVRFVKRLDPARFFGIINVLMVIVGLTLLVQAFTRG